MKVFKVSKRPSIGEEQISGTASDATHRLDNQGLSIAQAYSAKSVGPKAVRVAQTQDFRECCRRELRWRLARADYFGNDLFTDPAWDILLLLYSEELWRGGMAPSDFDRLGLPLTTVERWLKALDQKGLIQSIRHSANSLQIRVGLTERTRDAMIRYFAARSSD